VTGVTGTCPRACFRPELTLGILAALVVPPVAALDGVEMTIGEILGDGWQVRDARAALTLTGDEPLLELRAGRLEWPDGSADLKDLSLRCTDLEVGAEGFHCTRGVLDLAKRFPSPIPFSFSFSSRSDSGKAQVSIPSLADGTLQASAVWDEDDWRLELKAQGLSLDALTGLWPAVPPDLLPGGLRGRTAVELSAGSKGSEAERVTWKINVDGAGFSAGGGLWAGEDLALRTEGELKRAGASGWRGPSSVRLTKGALLTPYGFLDTSRSLTWRAHLELGEGFERIVLTGLSIEHPPLVRVKGKAVVRTTPLQIADLTLETESFDLQEAYRRYLEPVLAETLLEDVAWEGRAQLSFDLRRDGRLRLSATLHDLGVEDRLGRRLGGASRFALHGLNGRVAWSSSGQVEATRLKWAGGHILEKLELGPSQAAVLLQGGSLTLTDATELPVLDGSLVIDRLSVGRDPARPDRLVFDGFLTPISMERLSSALGWPPLSGTLSGMIPGLTYEKGAVEVEGTLLVRVFDGRVLIRDLRVRDLFGALPTLTMNLEMADLDLETLTRAFSFGRITGKLEGEVNNLRLEAWDPVSFDARFATPPGDSSRRRISQQAVASISELGGGLSGAVSQGFMGIFKDFNYDRLGISCRLRSGVCEMGGVGAAEQGYYLVTGRGIPQINVIGFNRQVDWKQLIERLKRAIESGSPVVE